MNKVNRRCVFSVLNPATLQKLEAFARAVDWEMPHPLHRRRFQKFILEAFKQGDTRPEPEEIEQAVIRYCGKRPIHFDEWIREDRAARNGPAVLKVNLCKIGATNR